VTIAETYAPSKSGFRTRAAYNVALVGVGSAFIALTAQISFTLPFSPVPVTGQTFGVLLLAALLGRVRGTLAVATYLAEGLCGLPVFAGGMGSAVVFLGPTGGYLLGFLPAAFVVGALAERGWDKRAITSGLAMVLGAAAIFAVGLSWLKIYVGVENTLTMGLYPFLAGEAVKIAAAMVTLPALRRFV
jgi:biotin transport system substrate-specific component